MDVNRPLMPGPGAQPDHLPVAGSADLGIHDPLAESFPPSREGWLLFWIAVAFSLFQLATALNLLILPSQIVRAVHVGFLTLLVFPLIGAAKGEGMGWRIAGWVLALAGVGVALYQWVFYRDLIVRSGYPTTADLVVGVILIAVVLLGALRAMGPALPIISGFFLLYCFFGQYMPSPLDTRGYDFGQVINQMAFGTEGIYGTPVYVSSTYIFLFILFGAFMERAGMIQFFTDVALGLVGHARGGAAKVAVISSGLMGTISGSGVANVVTTGQFTIPLMKRFGYRAAFAGGGRGDLVDGRADHAAGDGRRRLHHGRDARCLLRHGGQGGAGAGAALFRLDLLDGPSGSRQARPARPAEGGLPLGHRCGAPALVSGAAAGACSSICCLPATRRSSPVPSVWP